MRIDVHAHYWTDAYLDRLVDLGRSDTATQRGIGAGGGTELDARLWLMDRAGIGIQVLSAAPHWCRRIRIDFARLRPPRCPTSTPLSPKWAVR